MTMGNEEVPVQAARFFGHVCGVIAVAMAALSGWGLWHIVGAGVSGHLSVIGMALVACSLGLTGLFFRWAGVLTGHWSTHGKLAVPRTVYAGIGVLCVSAVLAGLYVLLMHPLPVWETTMVAFGTMSGGVLAYWCSVLLKNQRK